MKKMWKKNNKAVSPVIATILMVAITVVLAAVLYVMVMGFGGTSDNNPTAALTSQVTSTAHQEKVSLSSISEASIYTNFKISIVVTTAGIPTSYLATFSSAGVMTWTPALPTGTNGLNVTFVDISGITSGGTLGIGDYFLLTGAGTVVGSSITVSLLYGNENASIASTTFTLS